MDNGGRCINRQRCHRYGGRVSRNFRLKKFREKFSVGKVWSDFDREEKDIGGEDRKRGMEMEDKRGRRRRRKTPE